MRKKLSNFEIELIAEKFAQEGVIKYLVKRQKLVKENIDHPCRSRDDVINFIVHHVRRRMDDWKISNIATRSFLANAAIGEALSMLSEAVEQVT